MSDNIEKKLEEFLNGWKRAQADLINYKKDEDKRFAEIIKFANEAFVLDLLPVLDSLDLAEKSGVDCSVIKSQFENVMEKRGVGKIEVKAGEQFDPKFHEAVDVVEDGQGESNTIIEVVSAGYKLHEKVIRPVKVKVSK